MNLISKNLDVLLTLQISLELLDVLSRLILGGQQAQWDLDVGGVGGVDHCRVAFGAGFEGGVGFGRCERYDFAAPAELVYISMANRKRGKEEGRGVGRAYTDDTPGLDRIVLGLDFLQCAWELGCSLGGSSSGLKEVAKSLSLLFVVGGVPVSQLAMPRALLGIVR